MRDDQAQQLLSLYLVLVLIPLLHIPTVALNNGYSHDPLYTNGAFSMIVALTYSSISVHADVTGPITSQRAPAAIPKYATTTTPQRTPSPTTSNTALTLRAVITITRYSGINGNRRLSGSSGSRNGSRVYGVEVVVMVVVYVVSWLS